MTVCIAAIGHEGGHRNKRIVMCTDARVGGALGSTDWAFKQIHIGQSWWALTAGDEPDILALAALYKRQFANPDAVLPENIDASIKAPLFQRKQDLAEQMIRDRFAISFDDFKKYGKERLPDDLFREAMRLLREIDLKAEFILAGFIDDAPEIYSFDGSGRVCAASDYAVCGSGFYLAHAALMRREQNALMPLELTIYNAFEAKRISESTGSVGQRTNMSVLFPNGDREISSYGMDRQLAEMYETFGPKKVPLHHKFEGHYYFSAEKAAEDAAKEEAKPTIPGLEDQSDSDTGSGSGKAEGRGPEESDGKPAEAS